MSLKTKTLSLSLSCSLLHLRARSHLLSVPRKNAGEEECSLDKIHLRAPVHSVVAELFYVRHLQSVVVCERRRAARRVHQRVRLRMTYTHSSRLTFHTASLRVKIDLCATNPVIFQRSFSVDTFIDAHLEYGQEGNIPQINHSIDTARFSQSMRHAQIVFFDVIRLLRRSGPKHFPQIVVNQFLVAVLQSVSVAEDAR